MKTQNSNTEQNLRLLVSRLLRIGVLTAAVITIFGGILFFIQHPGTAFEYKTFSSEPARLRNALIIIKEAFSFKSRAIIQFGILFLIATPVARVLFSLVDFWIKKDWIFVMITSIVTIILFYSLFA